MKKQITKLGFTLIELLVVITIIGILATGATTVYTSQIQKARDSNRITDIKALQWAFEQAYSDASLYPYAKKWNPTDCDFDDTSKYWVMCLKTLWYTDKMPADKKAGSKGSGNEILNYLYNVWALNWVTNQIIEVSTAFEAQASVNSKAKDKVDWWNYAKRFEAWNWKSTLATEQIRTDKVSCHWARATSDYSKWIIIAWDCS